MNVFRSIAVAAIVVIFGLAAGPVEARQWRATPESQAMDYAQIIDARSAREVVLVMWMAPEVIEETSENAAGRQALSEFVIIGVVHAKISDQGVFTYIPHDEIAISLARRAPRRPLGRDAISPLTAGIISALQSFMEQALGPMGQGMQWLVFDSEDIRSCGAGEFWVAYAGENYNYETPIPGCPAS